MGDMGDLFRDLREDKKQRHEEAYEKNMQVLAESGIECQVRPTTVLFRSASKPRVDFYPHTGRWKVLPTTKNGKARMMRGGAKAFLVWYATF